jgi:hypothetical protein
MRKKSGTRQAWVSRTLAIRVWTSGFSRCGDVELDQLLAEPVGEGVLQAIAKHVVVVLLVEAEPDGRVDRDDREVGRDHDDGDDRDGDLRRGGHDDAIDQERERQAGGEWNHRRHERRDVVEEGQPGIHAPGDGQDAARIAAHRRESRNPCSLHEAPRTSPGAQRRPKRQKARKQKGPTLVESRSGGARGFASGGQRTDLSHGRVSSTSKTRHDCMLLGR